MEIKKLTRSNLDETIDLIYNTTINFNTSHIINNDSKSKEMFKSFFKEAFDDMDLFGYFDKSKLLGVIGIEDKNYIPILYVLKEYQNLNIGTKLLQFVQDYFENKTDFIEICAYYKAIPFYEKNGFKINGEIIDNKVMMIHNLKEKSKKL